MLRSRPGQAHSALRAFSSVCTRTSVNVVGPLLSSTIFFPFHLFAEIAKFPLLNWTNFEDSFCWPATFRAKSGAIRELKATIRTTIYYCGSPELYSALELDWIFYWSATFRAKNCGIREMKTTIQTNFFGHCCSPELYSALDPDCFLVSS